MTRFLAVAALLLVTACAGGGEEPVTGFRERNPDGLHGAVLPKPYQLPTATLTDSHGQRYEVQTDTTKPITLVFFGYTHCPDICQVVMADLTAALARLESADREQLGMLFITSDPARDDPATLRRYLDRFDPTFEGLTGPLATIARVGRALGVVIDKGDKLPSGGYAVAHGSQVVGVLADGTAPVVWTAGTSSADMADDLTKALRDGIPKVGSAG